MEEFPPLTPAELIVVAPAPPFPTTIVNTSDEAVMLSNST
jgi:hypothetical protein